MCDEEEFFLYSDDPEEQAFIDTVFLAGAYTSGGEACAAVYKMIRQARRSDIDVENILDKIERVTKDKALSYKELLIEVRKKLANEH